MGDGVGSAGLVHACDAVGAEGSNLAGKVVETDEIALICLVNNAVDRNRSLGFFPLCISIAEGKGLS